MLRELEDAFPEELVRVGFQRSVAIITVHVKAVDIMSVRSLKSVSGVVGVEIEMINGGLKDLMDSVSLEIYYHARS